MDDLDEDEEPAPAAAQVPRWGQAGGFTLGCPSHAGRGVTQGHLPLRAGKELPTGQVPLPWVEAQSFPSHSTAP